LRAFTILDSASAQVEHPAIVPIYETGTLPDDRVFYAMKLVAGARLRSHAKWMGFRG
jgi:hypothetical protein